jgi:hypothetical protein
VVGFDTTILPGREGSITEEVSVAKIHDGAFTKCITVTSNASNKADLHLCIKGVVKVPVSVMPQYIQLKASPNGVFETELTVTSEKKDLEILDVNFMANASSDGAASQQTAWQNNLPIHCSYKTVRPEKPKGDGAWEYKCTVSLNLSPAKAQYGDFIIKTNHPDMPEVKITGVIEVVEAQKK